MSNSDIALLLSCLISLIFCFLYINKRREAENLCEVNGELQKTIDKLDESIGELNCDNQDYSDLIDKLEAESKNPKKQSLDAQQLIHDLTKGEAVVRIIPISPGDIFLRSPK